ncbi:hypothetical protein N7476_006778, partial [Penicillium atrosanguineum]
MLWMCTTRFDLQEQKRLILQEYLSYQEIAAITEANKTREESFKPISDTEEDNVQPQDRDSLPQSYTTTVDLKGIEAIDYDEDNDDDTDLPLPDTQQRVSSRKLSYFTDQLSEANFLQSDDLPILISTRGMVTLIAPSKNYLPSYPILALSSLQRLISITRLPFHILERPKLQELCDVIQLASSKIKLPSPRSIRRQLDKDITQGQRRDWEYREVLLRFEPLHGSHTGSNLSTTIIEILQKHSIADRVLSVTTDNTTNNNTMISSIQDEIRTQGIGNANVFRLSLNQLLRKIKAAPVNNEAEVDWSDKRAHSLYSRRLKREIIDTLNKKIYPAINQLILILGPEPCHIRQYKSTAPRGLLSLQTEEPRLISIQG